jgi:hypothetical protein
VAKVQTDLLHSHLSAIKLREDGAPDRLGLVEREQATATAKYGGLSTAQRTMKLSVASVEMTVFLGLN